MKLFELLETIDDCGGEWAVGELLMEARLERRLRKSIAPQHVGRRGERLRPSPVIIHDVQSIGAGARSTWAPGMCVLRGVS